MLQTVQKDRPQPTSGFKKGVFGGYTQYRYGVIGYGHTKENLRSRISLANSEKTQSRVFRGERRKNVIDAIVDEMRDWRSSPFEQEASLQHGIRSTLCLHGYSWLISQTEAEALVSAALTILGAERPSWDQGQRWYAESRDQCLHCGKLLDVPALKAVHFCGEVCARASLERRDYHRRNETDKTYAAARRIVQKSKTKPRTCAWCGTLFHPVREKSAQKCCSFSCGSKLGHQRKPREVRTLSCAYCGCDFQTTSVRAIYCSNGCQACATKLKNGTVPTFLSCRIFDYYFTVPINATARPLTPQSFDWMMLEQGCAIVGEVKKLVADQHTTASARA